MIAEDEPTFKYNDEIKFIDLLHIEDFQTLHNETQESSIYEDNIAKTWKDINHFFFFSSEIKAQYNANFTLLYKDQGGIGSWEEN